MTDKIRLGKQGEETAARFLVEKGFTIVARNYRSGRAEIDLIARRDDWVVFVEVKTRTSTAYGEPEDFVTIAQASAIYRAAEDYILATDWQGHVRFDIVSVKMGAGNEVMIDHLEDAIN